MKQISPKYMTILTKQVEQVIWDTFHSYDMVERYITQWQSKKMEGTFDCCVIKENFQIRRKYSGDIDLFATLSGIDDETLMKIAIDLGIDTPDFIPCVPTFRNTVKEEYQTTSNIFEKAYKLVHEDASMAIGLANSALESLIKEILKDERVNVKWSEKDTIHKLVSAICTAFRLDDKDVPTEIKTICSSLKGATDAIEKLRSDKTSFHGKTNSDYIISEPLYAEFVVNSVCTIGLFLHSYYKAHYPAQTSTKEDEYEEFASVLPPLYNKEDFDKVELPF